MSPELPYPHGIKVQLETGEVSRVKEILSEEQVARQGWQSAAQFTGWFLHCVAETLSLASCPHSLGALVFAMSLLTAVDAVR